MTQSPLVTVICLCYNQSAYVSQALDSVLNQSYKNIEIIVVNDASTDDSKTIIEKKTKDLETVTFINLEKNTGPNKAFNLAAKKANGSYIMDLAADDFLEPNAISSLVTSFIHSKHSKTALVFGNANLVTKEGTFLKRFFETNEKDLVLKQPKTGSVYIEMLKGGVYMCSVSALFSKKHFDLLGGYDETLAYEDLDFWLRLSYTYHIDFTDTIITNKRVVASSLGSQFKNKNKLSKKINSSTFTILKKTLLLNKNKAEDKAVQQRINYEIIAALKRNNFVLVLKYALLKAQFLLRFRS